MWIRFLRYAMNVRIDINSVYMTYDQAENRVHVTFWRSSRKGGHAI